MNNKDSFYETLAVRRRKHAKTMCGIQGLASNAEEYERIVGLLERHIIPDKYPAAADSTFSRQNELGMDSFIYRDLIVKNSGFALISSEWVQPLAQWIGKRRCLEIMSGSGALAYALAQNGVEIIATDNSSWAEKYDAWFSHPWTKVEAMHCLDAIETYAQNCDLIICSWPYMDDDAYNALLKMRAVNPEAMMIYIGEWGGATANEKFTDAAVVVDDPQFSSAVKQFKQMHGIYDWPYLVK